jgi:medium-chain acyl-[acyl-carrier-protein] hydrolase
MISSGPGKSAILPPYEVVYPVFSFLLDPMQRLSLPATFGIFGDAAGRDATRRGWGYHELRRRNLAWVLVRATLVIGSQPAWGQDIRIRTWPKMMEGVTAYRDFLILDHEDHELMRGTTAWTLLDLKSRRLVRLTGKEFETGDLANLHALEERPSKIAWDPRRVPVKRVTAEYGHLDMNNHVNNTRYIEWILNEIPAGVLRERQMRKVELNFMAEVRHLDALSLFVSETETDSGIFNGFIEIIDGNRQAFAARFTFV